MIRKGHNGEARLRIKLLNTGEDAFEYDSYGDSIIVERRIQQSGGGSYTVFSKDMKKVGGKAELDKILDKFNIQVENPLSVLDQENSKLFLKV